MFKFLLLTPLFSGPTSGTVLGEELVHMVMTVRHLDTIATDIRRADTVRVEMETSSTLAALLALYGMTFTARGREALVKVLTTADHLDCLLELCRHSSLEGRKDMKKSAIRGFASELLLLAVRSSEDVDWLQRYGSQLFDLGRHDEHSKLSELAVWCSPLHELGMEEVFTEAAVPGLVEVLNRQLETREGEERGNLGSDAVTACRILKWMIFPSQDSVLETSSTRQVVAFKPEPQTTVRSGLLSPPLTFHRAKQTHLQDWRSIVSDQELGTVTAIKNFKNTLSLKNSLAILVKRGG